MPTYDQSAQTHREDSDGLSIPEIRGHLPYSERMRIVKDFYEQVEQSGGSQVARAIIAATAILSDNSLAQIQRHFNESSSFWRLPWFVLDLVA